MVPKRTGEALFYVQLSCHPHIVRTFGLVESDPNSVMLVQEYAEKGDLAELMRENNFQPVRNVLVEIFTQIIDAMICLADNKIVHGDLACRNVLVFRCNSNIPEENLVKLTDFGLTKGSDIFSVASSSSQIGMHRTRSVPGNPGFGIPGFGHSRVRLFPGSAIPGFGRSRIRSFPGSGHSRYLNAELSY
jgi:serine/threonine protein kinase